MRKLFILGIILSLFCSCNNSKSKLTQNNVEPYFDNYKEYKYNIVDINY